MQGNEKRWLHVVLGILYCVSAIFHAVCLFVPSLSRPEPPEEHLAFAGVNLAMGVLFFARAEVLWVAVVLAVHQVLTHGYRAVTDFHIQDVVAMVFAVGAVIALRAK